MKRILIVLILLMTITNCKSQPDYFDYAFESIDGLCVINITSKNKLCFHEYCNPCLSPDGTKLTVTKSIESGDDYARQVVIIDLKTKKEIKLNVNNNNFYDASWSPDNQYITFNIIFKSNWTIGIIRTDNTDFKTVKLETRYGLFSPTWYSDNNHFIAHDMSSVYKFDLNGNLIDSINIRKELGERCFISSKTKFSYTPDNQYLVFNCSVEDMMKNVEGPVEAVFAYEIKSKNLIRLSPQGLFASQPFVESNRVIVFSGSKENEKIGNVYRINLTDKKLELIIKNGANYSSRTK